MANESILKDKADILCGLLQNQNIDAYILQDSIREFSIKIALGSDGKFVLYYSPKKDSFKYSLEGIKENEVLRKVELVWEEYVNHKLPVGFFEKEVTEKASDVNVYEPGSGNTYDIYVDGSFLNDFISYGFVVLRDGEEIYLESAIVEKNKENENLRQIGGEIAGVENAIKYCKRKAIADVNIFYDYEGLAKWPLGEWKTNTQLTHNYKKTINESGIEINWLKVEAHTGNIFNEKVDMLAKNIISQQLNSKSLS